jgi:kynurenine formamidase
MVGMAKHAGTLTELLKDAPRNWGRFGPDDEVGSLNFLTAEEVLRGVKSVKYGKTFTLMLQLGHPVGEPLWPGQSPSGHYMNQDKGKYEMKKIDPVPGGCCYADDILIVGLHGTTHCDALAHTWYDDQAWNGVPADKSKGGLEQAGIMALAERGIVGHAVLLDVARYQGVPYLPMHRQIALDDLLQTAKHQNVEIRKHDIIIWRTGIFNLFYQDPAAFNGDFDEPGITYEPELVEWFHDMEIPVNASDILSGEETASATAEAGLPLHAALSRNLGVVFIEAHWLEKWAGDCARDQKYDGLYMASPLKITGGTASPVNPIVIK